MSKITWIHFNAIHGPGHQSHTEEYCWFTYKLSDEDIQYELESWCQQFSNTNATADRVDKPPPEEIERLVSQLKNEINANQRAIKSLLEEVSE